MSLDKLKNSPNLLSENELPKEAKSQTQQQNLAGLQIAGPSAADIRRLAEDLVRTHGEQFANVFGVSLFGADFAQLEDSKRRKTQTSPKKPIERVWVQSQSDVRTLVTECLDPVYRLPHIVEALTQYLCNHYEMVYQIDLPPES